MKKALIFGVTGQDGSYLSEFLLNKGYLVFGVKRKSSSLNTNRVDHIYQDPFAKNKNFVLCYGDLSDPLSINHLINSIKPNEIYNLAAQSHVAVSFELPDYSSNINAIGSLRILESIKTLNLKNIRYYQAGTSEMFGGQSKKKLNEKSIFNPRSPYAVSKVYAHFITKNYRESYDMFASNGILFNHESPRRGETFVTRKITIGLSKIKLGLQKKLVLGNLNAKRDWGHAKDYVEAMWKIMQYKFPGDFVISTGKSYSVKEFINECAKVLRIKIVWKGTGISTKAYDYHTKKCIIECSKRYYRPSEVDYLLGDSSVARKKLKWSPKISFKELVEEMTLSDYDFYKKKIDK
jgi:GDPmannose 4,6-dehydratase